MSEPLTDEELVHLETIAGPWTPRSPENQAQATLVLRLVAEVRRLRSDDWLQRAAEEIKSNRWTSPLDGDDKPLDVVAILRKQRDGA